MAQVETVLGSIDSGQLGFTLSHEHVYVFMGEDNHHYPWMFDLDATRVLAANVERFKARLRETGLFTDLSDAGAPAEHATALA